MQERAITFGFSTGWSHIRYNCLDFHQIQRTINHGDGWKDVSTIVDLPQFDGIQEVQATQASFVSSQS